MNLWDGWSDGAGMMYDGRPWRSRTCRVSKKLFAKYMWPDTVYSVWQVNSLQLTTCVYVTFFWGGFSSWINIEHMIFHPYIEKHLWLLIALEDWKRSNQVPLSRWLIPCDHKPRTTFWDYLGPAVMQGWRLTSLNSKDLIKIIFQILPMTMETSVRRITNSLLNGKILGENIQLLMTCSNHN